MSEGEGVSVSYDVKDLLETHAAATTSSLNEIKTSLATLGGRLDGMATKGDLATVHRRIDDVDDRVGKIEESSIEKKAIAKFKDQFVKFSGWIAAGVLVPIGSALLYAYLTASHR
jgi:hypothetical protein